MAGRPGILLEGSEHFCVGPDTRLRLWYGRRSQLEDHVEYSPRL